MSHNNAAPGNITPPFAPPYPTILSLPPLAMKGAASLAARGNTASSSCPTSRRSGVLGALLALVVP